MGNEWADKAAGAVNPNPPAISDIHSYAYIKCPTCPFKMSCPLRDESGALGCRQRKALYQDVMSKIVFKTKDPLTENRIKLVSSYYTELMLRRYFGAELTGEENINFKICLAELEKLWDTRKGDLPDLAKGPVVPWEQDEHVQELRREVENARAITAEYDRLKSEDEKRRSKDGTDPAV